MDTSGPLCNYNSRPGYHPAGYTLKDHCVIKKDGVWHCFGIKSAHGMECTDPGNEVTFIHARSTDLVNWTTQPDVIRTVPDTYEANHVWAPTVIERFGTYYMFYAMIRMDGKTPRQRIGYATSTDLSTWTQHSSKASLWDPATFAPWAGWAAPYDGACRDPFVMWDDAQSKYIMYYTAVHSNWKPAIGVATSTDLIRWTDAGFCLRMDSGGRWGTGQLESPHVIKHGDIYYLFYNHGAPEPPDGTGNGIHWVSSENPFFFGDVPPGRIDPYPRFGALKMSSLELLYGELGPYPGADWLFTVGYDLKIGRIVWENTIPEPAALDLAWLAREESTCNAKTPANPGSSWNVLTIRIADYPVAKVGVVYEYKLAASGGEKPFKWTAEGLDGGLKISKGGVISGTPKKAGKYNVKILVTDRKGKTSQVSLEMRVE